MPEEDDDEEVEETTSFEVEIGFRGCFCLIEGLKRKGDPGGDAPMDMMVVNEKEQVRDRLSKDGSPLVRRFRPKHASAFKLPSKRHVHFCGSWHCKINIAIILLNKIE